MAYIIDSLVAMNLPRGMSASMFWGNKTMPSSARDATYMSVIVSASPSSSTAVDIAPAPLTIIESICFLAVVLVLSKRRGDVV